MSEIKGKLLSYIVGWVGSLIFLFFHIIFPVRCSSQMDKTKLKIKLNI